MSEVRRRPGGRSARVRSSVLAAALAVLVDHGVERFSIAEVATRAGVHETSIYRGWISRERLMIDALMAAGEEVLPIPDTGSLRDDLVRFASSIVVLLSSPLGRALDHAFAVATDDPAIVDACTSFFNKRFELASSIIRRAIERGDVAECADPALAIELLVAPLHFRYLLSHAPLNEDFAEQLAVLVISGLAGRASLNT